MKVYVIGVTGLLGLSASRILLERGHEVRGIARRGLSSGVECPAGLEVETGDVTALSDEVLEERLTGCEALVYAIGADERVAHSAPVYPHLRRENVEECARVVRIARSAGVRRLVVLGSYFVHFHREWPELRLDRHPYIRSRIEQEEAVFEAAGPEMTVSILELPYIFGTIPGRDPIWGFLVEMIRSPKTVYFPKGGTAMVTADQVACAIAGAVERVGESGSYPIGGRNLSWVAMIELMLEAMGLSKRIVTVPTLLARIYGIVDLARSRFRGEERGINPVHYMDFQTRNSFIDPRDAMEELAYGEDDLAGAIRETVQACIELSSPRPS